MKKTMKFLFTSAKASCLGVLFTLCASTSAEAAPSSDGSGEIAIYTEVAGTDVITTADFAHDFDTNDREDGGSFTRSGADITLNRDGHYLAIYNARFNGAPQAGTEERVEIQSYLNLAGTDLPIGWSQGFIRRQQNHLDAITTGMAVIEATANDVLQLHSFRTDTTAIGSVTRFPDDTAIQLVKLDEVNMSYARLSLAADQTGPTDDIAVKVVYDTTDELDAGFSYAAGDLTLADAGKYLVIANSYITGPNARIGFVQELTLDGTAIPGTRTNIYIRGSQSTQEGAAAIGTIIETTAANQVLSVLGEMDGGAGATNYIGGRCGLTVVKLPSAGAGTSVIDPDFIRLSHSADQDVNTTADLIFDTQLELDPDFTHSVGSSDISVGTGGDYLFLGSFYGADDGAARGLPNPGWAINGTRLNRGQSGRYTRNIGPGEFGNTLGLVASDLASGDQIKMVTRALAAAGTNNANPVALQGVRLSSLFTAPADFEVTVVPGAIATTEDGATATYDMALGLAPASGGVTVTISPDAQSEVSSDGTNFSSTLDVTFTDTTSQTITVRASDDAIIESAHSSTITQAITATDDPTNYPTTQAVPSVINSITDNDVVPVNAVDDIGTSNVSEDAIANETILAPQGDLLANDTAGLNNLVSAFDSSSALGAAVNVLADGTFFFDPTGAGPLQALAAGATVVDTFSYTTKDADGNSDTATVSITVEGANDGLEAIHDYLNDGPLENATSFVSAVDLTANDGAFRTVSTDFLFPPGSDLRELPGKIVTQTPSVGTPPGNGFPENAFDGNIGTFTHTQSNNNAVDHSWQVDLGVVASLESVTLANRNDCCGARLRDITVRVLDGGGVEVFNSGSLNVANALGFAGGASETLFVDFAGPIMGQTVIVEREPDLGDADAGNGSILSLSEVTLIGSVPGISTQVDDLLLLNYEASQSANTGRWENRGEVGGTAMDWVLTDITLDSSPGSARSEISSAYEWDNAADDATLSAGVSGSIHDNVPGDPDNQNATWEFWVKPANITSVMTLFETGGGTGFGFIINNGVLEAATELDGFAMNGSYVSYDLDSDPQGLVGGDPTTEFNQYAVTITINGGLQLYVNGVKVDETTTGVGGDWDGGDGAGLGSFGENNHGGFQNGATGTTYDAPFLGQMAIVRLYSGVLSGAQILQNFIAVSAGTDIDGDSISVDGVIDGNGAFVANGSPATLASGAIVTMNNATGGFDYNPNGVFSLLPGETATDAVTYRVTDGNGEVAQADAIVTITGVASPIDDNLLAKEEMIRIFTPNELVQNDETLATPGAYINLIPSSFMGVTWTNLGSSGAARNATVTGSVVSAPDLTSGFQTIGSATRMANLTTLDAISTAAATLEIWFRPEAGQTGKRTIFETGGNGNGFSIVYDPSTNEVTATVDGGDDTTAIIQATATGVSTTEFNQLIVVIEPNGGAEVAATPGTFEDLLTVYLNNDPLAAFDAAVDGSGINLLGTANDWAGTDNGGFNTVSGTTAINENFPGMDGEVAIFRAYTKVLSEAEMEANYDANILPITAVSSPSADLGLSVTLNGDGTISVDYSGVALAPGASLMDSFTYTTIAGTATASVLIEGNTIQEDWRSLYYGSIDNEGAGADSAISANGLTNLQSFALDLDPTMAAGVLDIDQGAGTITSLGPPIIWIDSADGRIYLQHTRRSDFAAIPLTITDQFSRDLGVFEDSAVPPAVIATGVGDSGVAIEAVQTELPLILPISGGKARFGRVEVTRP